MLRLFVPLLVLNFALSGCTEDDEVDPILFMEKFEMTEWQWTKNYCTSEDDEIGAIFNVEYLRFEKDHPGYMRLISYNFPIRCEEGYSGCFRFRDYNDPRIKIEEQTENHLSYIITQVNTQGSLYNWRYTFTYKDGIMTIKKYYYSDNTEYSQTFIKSDIELKDYLCD